MHPVRLEQFGCLPFSLMLLCLYSNLVISTKEGTWLLFSDGHKLSAAAASSYCASQNGTLAVLTSSSQAKLLLKHLQYTDTVEAYIDSCDVSTDWIDDPLSVPAERYLMQAMDADSQSCMVVSRNVTAGEVDCAIPRPFFCEFHD